MRYEYKKASLADLEALNKMGDEGWEVCTLVGTDALLKKCLPTGCPSGTARACSNCKHFSTQVAEKDKNAETPGWCGEWKLAMQITGSCEKFVQKEVIPGAVTPLPAGAVPDHESAWHWQPRTELGEKRVEAITSQVAGASAPDHKHRVLVILSKDGKIVRGKTDMVNGHEHKITLLGMTEEADGHTHTWIVPG
jgi:hypothetical protein